jgi:hypothetical protein
VRKGADKLQKFLNSKQQGRLDGFFSVKSKEKAPAPTKMKGKDKGTVDTRTKGAKRKVCSKKSPFSVDLFSIIGRRESGKQWGKEISKEIISFFHSIIPSSCHCPSTLS